LRANILSVCILAFLLFYKIPGYSQKFISDTLIVSRPKDSVTSWIRYPLIQVKDLREGNAALLWITEKKRFGYIPVDHYVMMEVPLDTLIDELFIRNSKSKNEGFTVNIRKFAVSKRKGRFFPAYSLNAIFDIYKVTADASHADTIAGILVYDEDVPVRGKPKGAGMKEQQLIGQWEKKFKEDINKIGIYKRQKNYDLPYNFFSFETKIKTSLYTSVHYIQGLDFWILEGHILFSEPEAGTRFFRNGQIVRYRNEKTFESIAFGGNSEHLQYRLNNRWLADINSNFLIGINKWKDMDETEHPIWHVLLLDFSLAQYIRYVPFNSKPSFIFGGGIIEDFYYVPDGNFKFKPGISVQLGYRF
jgi:hypothetical protein